jgi:anti-sigma factor RsiW
VKRHDHLGKRLSAVVDGELDHPSRERALAHVAHCTECRAALEAERALKSRLAGAPDPRPSSDLRDRLLSLAGPGEPLPPTVSAVPSAGPAPLAPLIPALPPPGRSRRLGGPSGRRDARRPGGRGRAYRTRYVTAGALSVAGLMLGTAFVAGGEPQQPGAPVLPPAAELTVEHAATTSGLPLSDPAFDAVTASFGGLSFPAAPGR